MLSVLFVEYLLANQAIRGLIATGGGADDRYDQKESKAYQYSFSKGGQFIFFAAKGSPS
jgi:hypothetical protein